MFVFDVEKANANLRSQLLRVSYADMNEALFASELIRGDSFFYAGNNAGKTYNITDGPHAGFHLGGNINYFYQGYLHAARGNSMQWMGLTIYSWNMAQYYSGGGEYNLSQIQPARYWARVGFENWSGR
jgi:hypothetical protein